MDVELKPCPFCGGKPHMSRRGLSEVHAYADEVKIQCGTCSVYRSAMGDTSKPGYADNSTVEARAIEKWNTRTHSAEIAGALRDADEWKPIESAPRDGTAILGLWMPSPGAYTRVSGNNYGIVAFDDERGFWALVDDGDEPDEVMRPDYWRPLPAPPTLDSAMQQGGGGGA